MQNCHNKNLYNTKYNNDAFNEYYFMITFTFNNNDTLVYFFLSLKGIRMILHTYGIFLVKPILFAIKTTINIFTII